MIVCAMKSTPAIILKPILWGWAVCLTDGRGLARFHGPGARRRAFITSAPASSDAPLLPRAGLEATEAFESPPGDVDYGKD